MQGRYGEPIKGRVFGLFCKGVHYATRFYEWVINWRKAPDEMDTCRVESKPGFDLLQRAGKGELKAAFSPKTSFDDSSQICSRVGKGLSRSEAMAQALNAFKRRGLSAPLDLYQ